LPPQEFSTRCGSQTRASDRTCARRSAIGTPSANLLAMREYDLYVPSIYNDGRPIEPEKLAALKRRLVEQFGGLTHFPQENEGLWKVGSITFRDQIVILRVLAGDSSEADRFFLKLKEDLKREWSQEDVLIVTRNVSAV